MQAIQMLTMIRRVMFILFLALLALLMKADGWESNAKAGISHQPLPAMQGQSAVDYLKERGLYSQLQAAVESSRYEINRASLPDLPGRLPVRLKAAGEIYLADNPSQRLQAYFGAGQMVLEPSPSACERGWQAGLKLRGVGYGKQINAVTTGSARVSGNRIEIPHTFINEWYVNSKEGIEQGFTLAERPGPIVSAEPLRLAMTVTGELRARLEDDGQAVVLSRRDGKQALRYDHLVAYDATGRTLPARMEVSGAEISLLVEDASAVYPVTIDPLFAQVKKLTASDAVVGDFFGNSVGISGDTIVVGAYSKKSLTITGAAYIFHRNHGGADNWGQVKILTPSDGAVNDLFGISVGISGDTAVIGAPSKNSLTGAAYLYRRNQGGADNWGQVKKLTANDAATEDQFGTSVEISGETVVVGAVYRRFPFTGAAYIFKRNQDGADNWGQVKKLTANDATTYDQFGQAVGISGDTVVVAAVGQNSSTGAAYVYRRNQGGSDNWGQVKKLAASDGAEGDYFGTSVGINTDTVVIGAPNNNDYRGAAYIFSRNQGGADNWGQVRKLTASDGVATADFFGTSVGIDDDTIVVGAYRKKVLTGAAYIYSRNQGGSDNWGQLQKLTASDAAEGDYFGTSVGISGGAVVVGVPGKNSNTGAAYIFTNQCGQWTEVQKSTASDVGELNQIGSAVGLSGDTAVVGAPDSQILHTGAAYLYERNQGGADNWGQVRKLTISDLAPNDRFGGAVGISGDTVVVGAPGKDAAYIFSRNEGGANNWGQVKKLIRTEVIVNDDFGYSVGISGDTVVVGTYFKNQGIGVAYIFERNQGGADNWGQVRKLTAIDAGGGREFYGNSVGISGDTVVVGLPFDFSPGAAFIFSRNQGGADNWGQVKKLIPSHQSGLAQFGMSVGISGDLVVVGAEGDNSAYIFGRNQGGVNNWGEIKELKASGEFGYSVGVSGDTIVVGADIVNNFSGAAYIFGRNQGGADNWGQTQILTAHGGSGYDHFGNSVGISGNTIAVGANFKKHETGAAYIFASSCPPVISGATVSAVQGSLAASRQIATVSDAEQAANTLTATVTPLTGSGVTIGTPSINAAGQVTAGVQVSCTATNSTFTLTVTDNTSLTATATLTVNVTANTAPALSYANQTTSVGNALTINPATGPSDNGSITSIAVQSQGTYTGVISVNAAGVVSLSDVAPAGTHAITIRAADNCGATADATFNLTVSRLTGSIADPIVCQGPGGVVGVTATVTNGAATAQAASFTANLPAKLLALPGTCTASVGTCAAVNASTVTWMDTLAAGQTVTITYQAQIADGAIAGSQVCVTSTATVGGSSAGSVTACTTLNCPPSGPGLPLAAASPMSDQKAGSVLIYNVYTSSIDPMRQNTRLSITNTEPTRPAFVHLFFVDGASCSVADSFLCLTPNQTVTFLASDLDPGTTGYAVAVATDAAGCPTNFNYLIGDEYVKFQSGHAANLGAEAISAIAGGLPVCDTNSSTALLAFDGVSYNALPHVLAADNLPSRADGNDTMLIVNRIGGNLGTGAGTLGTLFGLFYDDQETGVSFQFTPATCQFRSSISNTFPRITPRFEQFVPAGRSGWFKLWEPGLFGISGALINFNANATASAGAFNQGHNLHALTNANTASYVVPVFPPNC